MMKLSEAFGGQRVKFISGIHIGKTATVYEPSQEVFGLRLIVGNEDIHLKTGSWNKEHDDYMLDELEALEHKPVDITYPGNKTNYPIILTID